MPGLEKSVAHSEVLPGRCGSRVAASGAELGHEPSESPLGCSLGSPSCGACLPRLGPSDQGNSGSSEGKILAWLGVDNRGDNTAPGTHLGVIMAESLLETETLN